MARLLAESGQAPGALGGFRHFPQPAGVVEQRLRELGIPLRQAAPFLMAVQQQIAGQRQRTDIPTAQPVPDRFVTALQDQQQIDDRCPCAMGQQQAGCGARGAVDQAKRGLAVRRRGHGRLPAQPAGGGGGGASPVAGRGHEALRMDMDKALNPDKARHPGAFSRGEPWLTPHG